MFVCSCHAVSDGMIVDSIERGARSVAHVGRSCHAGTGCGACHVRIRQLLAEHESSGSPPRAGARGIHRSQRRPANWRPR